MPAICNFEEKPKQTSHHTQPPAWASQPPGPAASRKAQRPTILYCFASLVGGTGTGRVLILHPASGELAASQTRQLSVCIPAALQLCMSLEAGACEASNLPMTEAWFSDGRVRFRKCLRKKIVEKLGEYPDVREKKDVLEAFAKLKKNGFLVKDHEDKRGDMLVLDFSGLRVEHLTQLEEISQFPTVDVHLIECANALRFSTQKPQVLQGAVQRVQIHDAQHPALKFGGAPAFKLCAARDLRKNYVMPCPYGGEVRLSEELLQIELSADPSLHRGAYSMELTDSPWSYDAKKSQGLVSLAALEKAHIKLAMDAYETRSILAAANAFQSMEHYYNGEEGTERAPQPGTDPKSLGNAFFVKVAVCGFPVVLLVTRTALRKGQEILVDYGNGYWDNIQEQKVVRELLAKVRKSKEDALKKMQDERKRRENDRTQQSRQLAKMAMQLDDAKRENKRLEMVNKNNAAEIARNKREMEENRKAWHAVIHNPRRKVCCPYCKLEVPTMRGGQVHWENLGKHWTRKGGCDGKKKYQRKRSQNTSLSAEIQSCSFCTHRWIFHYETTGEAKTFGEHNATDHHLRHWLECQNMKAQELLTLAQIALKTFRGTLSDDAPLSPDCETKPLEVLNGVTVGHQHVLMDTNKCGLPKYVVDAVKTALSGAVEMSRKAGNVKPLKDTLVCINTVFTDWLDKLTEAQKPGELKGVKIGCFFSQKFGFVEFRGCDPAARALLARRSRASGPRGFTAVDRTRRSGPPPVAQPFRDGGSARSLSDGSTRARQGKRQQAWGDDSRARTKQRQNSWADHRGYARPADRGRRGNAQRETNDYRRGAERQGGRPGRPKGGHSRLGQRPPWRR
jgi:hypothetical protein